MKHHYSAAVVTKYDMVKLFLSHRDFAELSDLVEIAIAEKILGTKDDEAICRINLSAWNISEIKWVLAGEVTTTEQCYSKGHAFQQHQKMEVYLIKSVTPLVTNIPAIKTWCGPNNFRQKCGTIHYPREEAQVIIDSKTVLRLPKEKQNFNKPVSQKIGKTKYSVKLVLISSGNKI